MRCAGLFKHARHFIERAAGGHHVIDDEDVLAAQASLDGKRTPNVASPLLQRQRLLWGCVADTEQSIDDEAAVSGDSESACDMVRLIEPALAHSLERQRHRNNNGIVRGWWHR